MTIIQTKKVTKTFTLEIMFMTTIIKRCRGEKKRDIRAKIDLEKN